MLCMEKFSNTKRNHLPRLKCIRLIFLILFIIIIFDYDSSVFVSFGGLLMLLKGDPRHLGGIELDSRIYLLMRRL